MRIFFALIVTLFLLSAPTQLDAASQAGISPCFTTPPSLAVSTTSDRVQFGTCGEVVIVFNNGENDAFYKLGDSTVEATATDNLIPAKTFIVLNVGNSGLYLAAITALSTTTLYFTQGQAIGN